MSSAGRSALLIVFAGLIAGAVVAGLFLTIVAPEDRSDTFYFTCWTAVLQPLLLSVVGAHTALQRGVLNASEPVGAARITAALLYNLLAIGTVLLFTSMLLPRGVPERIYYGVVVSEFGAFLALLVLLGLVNVSHRAAHHEARDVRHHALSIVDEYRRVSAVASAKGWTIPLRLADGLRHSERLRSEPDTASAVLQRIRRLAELTEMPSSETHLPAVTQLLQEIEALSTT